MKYETLLSLLIIYEVCSKCIKWSCIYQDRNEQLMKQACPHG